MARAACRDDRPSRRADVEAGPDEQLLHWPAQLNVRVRDVPLELLVVGLAQYGLVWR